MVCSGALRTHLAAQVLTLRIELGGAQRAQHAHDIGNRLFQQILRDGFHVAVVIKRK